MKLILSSTVLLLFPLLTIFGQTKKDSLYVFVGEKISVTQFYPKTNKNEILMDAAFKAKYRIIQNVYNKYKKDTIEFEAYDHHGIPAFSKYKYVLLYVSNHKGKLYHEKYQYADVYRTKNGRWASSYQVGDYDDSTKVIPEKIDFVDEVSYNIYGKSKEAIAIWYPSPYFRIVKDKAIAIWGNYIEQLFELKKAGVLKARGIF